MRKETGMSALVAIIFMQDLIIFELLTKVIF